MSSKRIWPRADEEFSQVILDMVTEAANVEQLRKGANEATKTLNRGIAELIVIAADTEPLEIVLHLPLLCEDKNVPYIYVDSKAALGAACGVSRSVIAASIFKLKDSKSPIEEEIYNLKNQVESFVLAGAD
eukprot:TRINITY_DN1890_c0_g1_i1.p1 TRINITY_DN1890_c0_g1~~TRINITY_DN1890_c0_g1_i1.p1  ORF type:complete len:131 (+),score=40.57 TRINITY_DN1890_c0_g1_i1:52-444(+)